MKCSAATRSGAPCRANALKGKDVCSAHAGMIGGATPGAGRPPGERESKRKLIFDRASEAVGVLFAALDAVHASSGEPDWPVRIRAATYLVDQGLGKAIQTTELTGADGGPITITDLARLAAEEPDPDVC